MSVPIEARLKPSHAEEARSGSMRAITARQRRGELNPNARGEYGRTLAHWAACGQQLRLLKYFYHLGVLDVSSTDYLGNTVAHLCVWDVVLDRYPLDRWWKDYREAKCLKILAWLHSKGVLNVDLENKYCQKVSHLAMCSHFFRVLDWLHAQGLIDLTIYTTNNTPRTFEVAKWLYEHNLLEESVWKLGLDPFRDLYEIGHPKRLTVMKWLHSRQLLFNRQRFYDHSTIISWVVDAFDAGAKECVLNELIFYIDVLGMLRGFLDTLQNSLDDAQQRMVDPKKLRKHSSSFRKICDEARAYLHAHYDQ